MVFLESRLCELDDGEGMDFGGGGNVTKYD